MFHTAPCKSVTSWHNMTMKPDITIMVVYWINREVTGNGGCDRRFGSDHTDMWSCILYLQKEKERDKVYRMSLFRIMSEKVSAGQ